MRGRIHRGAHEIGGSCVEVEHDGHRIVLDLGRPLTAAHDEHVALPNVPGLAAPDVDAGLLGVVITHHHADHWGLVEQVDATVPLYLGAATRRILAAATFWSRGLDVPVAGELAHREPFPLGPFTVTPYLNDHSAYDAYSLLVEAGGRRLFYTGDIRGHGRKAGLFAQLLDDPPPDLDVLLLEGTNLQSGRPEMPMRTETDVEDELVDRFADTTGLALVVTSAQNIDRLVTIYRAALRSERTLLVDAYTADIARATGNANIPRPDPQWPRVGTFLPRWQARRIKDAGAFERLEDIDPYRRFEEDLATAPHHYVLLTGGGEIDRLGDAGALRDASCTWSLWDGYLEEPSGRRLSDALARWEVPLAQHHTSGHASVADLRRLAAALDPDRVVPIHTFGADEYHRVHDHVEVQPDGTWWHV